jgi:lipopolysaccharide heptosyltransferase I
MTQPDASFPTDFTRILLVKPSSIGDVVHALPVWHALRQRWPQARLSWLVSPACANIIDGLPDLELILFERQKLGQWWKRPAALKELLAFQRSLRERSFDLVLDLQGLFRSGWFSRCTRSPVRVGFANARELAPLFYTHRIPIYSMDEHAVLRNLRIAEAIGCEVTRPQFPLPITDEDRSVATSLTGRDGAFALLCPGANWESKRWPPQKFAELVPELARRFGLRTLLAGGPGDVPLAEAILAAAPDARSICGQTTLRQLAAVMEQASLVVTNDSGPMHIAAALKRPLVAVFGPTNPARTGPFRMEASVVAARVNCSPCYKKTCADCSCMTRVSPDEVLAAAEAQLRIAGLVKPAPTAPDPWSP